MKKPITLSQAEMILLATYRVANGTINRVPFEEIVLQVWRDFPQHFSLNNHPEHPDSYLVSKRLYSDLITKRLAVSLRKQVYRLTNRGLERAQQLERNSKVRSTESPGSGDHLNKDAEEFIQHAKRSRPFVAWKQGKGNDLIDFDARVFFQFSTGTPIRERKRKADSAREAIEKAVAMGLPEAASLQSLLNFFIDRFPELFKEA